MFDVREIQSSQTIYPQPATPGIAIANLNTIYVLKGMPVHQVGTIHLAVFQTGSGPQTRLSPELVGRNNDVSRGLPQGATLDANAGITLPGF